MPDPASIDSHVKALADLFIERFGSITGDYRQPWLPTLPFCAQNAAGHLYSGVNDVNLSLVCALRGYSCPVWLTGGQCRDLGVYKRSGEIGTVVYWGGTSFYDKERGVQDSSMRWADYQRLSPFERERYSLQESFGKCAYVWNLEQTDFPERHPDSWANLLSAFSPERKACDEKTLDAFLDKGAWYPDGTHRCPVIQTDTPAARYDRSVRFIEIPRKELFMDQRNFYSTLLHTLAHSAIIEQAVSTYKGDGDPIADIARLNLSSELAAAVMAGRLGFSQTLSKENLRYLRDWTQVLSDNPSVIRQVTREARYAVELMTDRLGVVQENVPDVCSVLGAEIAQAREARLRQGPARKRAVYDSVNARTGKPRLTRRRGVRH